MLRHIRGNLVALIRQSHLQNKSLAEIRISQRSFSTKGTSNNPKVTVVKNATNTSSKAETPKEAPKVNAVKVDAPKNQAPNVETPKTDTPKADTPKTQAPKTQAPRSKVETPEAEYQQQSEETSLFGRLLFTFAIVAGLYAGYRMYDPTTAHQFERKLTRTFKAYTSDKKESTPTTETITPTSSAIVSPTTPIIVEAATPVVDEPVIVEVIEKEIQQSQQDQAQEHDQEPIAVVEDVIVTSIPATDVDTSASTTSTQETTPAIDSIETTDSIPSTADRILSPVEIATLSAESATAATLLESSARLAELRTSFTSHLSQYETNRSSQLSRLSSTLRKSGPEAAERAIAQMEDEDRKFFESCQNSLTSYIVEIENNTANTLALARASQAAYFAEVLQAETEKLRHELDRQYADLTNTLVSEAVAKVTTGYEEQFLRMSLEHSKAIEALSTRYSEAVDTMMKRVEAVAKASALRKKIQAQAIHASKVNAAVVEVERLVNLGLPFTKPWAELASLAVEDSLLQIAMANVPEQIVKLGVSPVSYLQRQFLKLEFPIRRAAYMTPKNDIVSRFLSGIFALITVPQAELIGVPQDEILANAPHSATEPLNDAFYNVITHDHARLSRASFFMERGDIALAIQELSKLKGEHTPQLAQDFISESRSRLITVQTVGVLRSHAIAIHKESYEQ